MKVDIVITGSGVAAAALAWKILRANPGASILVLEAGERMKMRDFSTFQDFMVTGQEPHSKYWDLDYPTREQQGENSRTGDTALPLSQSRLTMYGGSTVHWGGWSFRMKEEDFRLESLTGRGIDWPFTYAELEEYYGLAEHYIGVSGDSEDTTVPRKRCFPFKAFPFSLEDKPAMDALGSLGIGYSHLPIARLGATPTLSSHAPCQTTGLCKYCPFGSRYVAANSLDDLANLESHPGFEIRTEIIVQEIVMTSKSRAGGVRCLDRRNREQVFIEAETVVVASGALESPKLLQRSGQPYWSNGIGNDHDLVGRNLITHPFFSYQAKLKDNKAKLQPEMGFPTLVSRHFDSPDEQKAGKFILVYPPDYPRYGPGRLSLIKLMQAGHSRKAIDIMLTEDVTLQWSGLVETFSEHRNYVKNCGDLNRFGLMSSRIHYDKSADFSTRMEGVGRHVTRIFHAMGATDAQEQNISWRADHAGCTTRMSDDPAEGVVDRNLRVHGTENIYVCSNASFSSLGAVNPTLTLTAISLRLADHLLEQRDIPPVGLEARPGDLMLTTLHA